MWPAARLFRFGKFSRRFSWFAREIKKRAMPSALLLLSEGAEEMETVIAADVMRRGEINVTVAGLNGKDPVTCSRNVKVVPDVGLAEVAGQSFDAVVLPGGAKGAKNLAESAEVGKILQKFEKDGKLIACVCAGPTALISHGILKGKKVTSHPSVKDKMVAAGYSYQEERVVVDGNLITSRAPGTSMEWALAIVEHLQGKAKRDSLVPPLVMKE